jgi:hypothetical protein
MFTDVFEKVSGPIGNKINSMNISAATKKALRNQTAANIVSARRKIRATANIDTSSMEHGLKGVRHTVNVNVPIRGSSKKFDASSTEPGTITSYGGADSLQKTKKKSYKIKV